ncbi:MULTISPECIES: chemotaxis protein CheW [Enterococcus]|uniref:Chemotaxis protein CheW n=2 Tax=Enterococcus gallinarum TaxID=1353 RepID=A0A3N3WT39_ENTGA|nr:chemotaxis protein CheW [Enterococcus gallinarum]MBF0823701.1 chemotaxis protein CheW [Enterococcus faecalis]MBF0725172.1 chemotaxis protein CheW [Enterococcus gallinarum]MBF0798221.1 chemotaxis protein CheW [Enterococcus gallinarum]MBM6741418.1 chemotaxis protein CheW [Enterococcus gallinarum]MBX8978700.1 chemotaxis protein CheW [Enterococcus gallinarum]
MEQYVIFRSHDQLFAIRVQQVTRVIEAQSFIQLPEVADFVLGVYEFQEKMIPIIDVRRKLFKEPTTVSERNNVILCHWNDQDLGLYVDEIVGISTLEETDYEAQLDRSGLKQSYIEQFLKSDESVVLLLALSFLFDYEPEEWQDTFGETSCPVY